MKHRTKIFAFVAAGLAVSGIALYWCLPRAPDDFPHPANGLWRQIHGAFVVGGIFCLGQMWSEHVRKQLKQWRRHLDGMVHFIIWILLTVSGYLLYYPLSWLPQWLNIGQWHWWLGVLLLLVIPVHVAMATGKPAAGKYRKFVSAD